MPVPWRRFQASSAFGRSLLLLLALTFLAGCSPTPETNVITYLLAQRLGTFSLEPDPRPPGALTGHVYHEGAPLEGAAVVVAERYGKPYAAYTDADGYYRIDGIPPGQYVPAAVAPGYEETVPRDRLGRPRLVTIEPNASTDAPAIELNRHETEPLPAPLAAGVNLSATGTYTASAPFPSGAQARVQTFTFEIDGVVNDSLRVYLPTETQPHDELPLLFVVYPGPTENWEPISVALSAPGYAVVALAPGPERGLDIDGHALDARAALNLALDGALDPRISDGKAVAMGGSFSSPVLRRLMRDEGDSVAAWITLGGISDAFSGAYDFYRGAIQVPPQHELAIPSLGLPNLYPLTFLRYSTIYAAGELPPTMVIHTAADEVTRIEQAYKLEAALREAGVPVEAYYYDDVSHYLQIGENMTEAGMEMYDRVLEFVEKYTDME